jgi:hypothetical protein
MKINKVHCFFEQSGTFKKEFLKLGIDAEDYDIQNNFGETDHVIDLFASINLAYSGKASVFDDISKEDIIIAFFPCIYFCQNSSILFYYNTNNYRRLNHAQRMAKILERSKNRHTFFDTLVKLVGVALDKGLRLIIENPWSQPHFLFQNFLFNPSYIDMDRTRRGDFYKKPTAYWFINCEPHNGFTREKPKKLLKIYGSKPGVKAGVCSEDRSLIAPAYARNFICDQILGSTEKHPSKQLELW